MQVLAEEIADFKERMPDRRQSAAIPRLANQITRRLDRFVARSDSGIDKLDRTALQKLAAEADALETCWQELEQLFDASTRHGEQVHRDLVVAHYRARFAGLEHEVERYRKIAEERSQGKRRSIGGPFAGLSADLLAVNAKIDVIETADLDGWRGLRRGLHQTLQRLEKKVNAMEEEEE